ncbi:putative MFS family arabinose efflux permease [Actinoplanes octamycinicus]|uniref:Putative MFS family arabinose efflux permease n=1 Tax=Actinoplanes octamycinicus TaxID=135948 RepID=A0A7W7GVG2_9ACTN|nr:MFS transporter [Actinoplanes octamycinicus]MBB4739046.1 putative MFS family arabinose efflux permease [Actinoplanes octamycinicus]GIE60177.1 MFS transporter [Actinoplanes octamycinicus]
MVSQILQTGEPTRTPAAPAGLSPAAKFRRFWFATTVSGAGSAVTLIALPLAALTILGSSAWQVTLLSAAEQAGWLVLGLPAGVIVRRCSLRGLQIAMDLIRLVAIGSVPVAWALGVLSYAQLLVAALAVGLASVLFDIGSSVFLPAIVDEEQLNSRNSLMSGTHAVTQTAGPSAGALIIQAIGPVGALLVDAGSYLVSALTLRTLPEHRSDPGPAAGALRQIKQGWHFVVRHPVMGPCLLWATVTNFFCAAIIALTPVYLVRAIGAPPATVGLVLAMDGAGGVLGALLATRLAKRLGTARALIVATLAAAAAALVIPFTHSSGTVHYFMIGNLGLEAGVVIGSILTRTYRMTASPPDLLAQVMATTRFVSWGALPLGAAAAGFLVTVAGLQAALWVVCAGMLLGPLVLLTSPLRGRRDFA